MLVTMLAMSLERSSLLLAILFYLYKKRENLIKPMIHGDKLPPVDAPASRSWALPVLAASSGFVYWLVSLGG